MRKRGGRREKNAGGPLSFFRSPDLPPSIHPFTEGKPLPTELRRDAAALKAQVELEDDNTAVPRTHVDDEYARAAEREPKVS